MPVHKGKDKDGPFFQWGNSGKKYHFTKDNSSAEVAAHAKAQRQGVAAYANGYKGK